MLISHRGNTIGPSEKENEPEYILETISKGFFVEVDVWSFNNKLLLGHDTPQYEVNKKILSTPYIIYHAKNLAALEYCLSLDKHCFWHENDSYTLTSKGFIWVYPNKQISVKNKCIIVDNKPPSFKYECTGICSDYVQLYKTYNF